MTLECLIDGFLCYDVDQGCPAISGLKLCPMACTNRSHVLQGPWASQATFHVHPWELPLSPCPGIISMGRTASSCCTRHSSPPHLQLPSFRFPHFIMPHGCSRQPAPLALWVGYAASSCPALHPGLGARSRSQRREGKP